MREIFGGDESGPDWWVVSCWAFTTLRVLEYSREPVHQARREGLQLLTAMLTDIWLLHDVSQTGLEPVPLAPAKP